jgi:DNA-binding GntR family transcriptional regulator
MQLRELNRAILNAISRETPDVTGFLEANRDFHAIILEKSASRRLAALLGTLIEQPVVWRTAHNYGRDALQRSYLEHEELMSAFARRDDDWAAAVMTAHIRRAFHAYADAHQGLISIQAA